ncbi:MAG: RsmB/NOP family class I SAM-dependent RNA methyltransferase [Alphaproteobacteria bacterium]|nr:RsmB/NOP family class I SAM-dependent RNA methyltransferase [Alphaproteobacteria bacterium]HPF47293.1 RsmB/NOP family class I SAM-dependent RNA methyltransferase [Emcibacteraceae bacterium]HRW29294.1 RsmB/NOP family class I SAM-dependent RNA methyltransferase [Emcibacteraceae bacterium]
MIPSARIEAVIDLTAQVAHSLKENGPAADVIVRNFFSTRRYAGSKDRRRITGLLYEIIRQWGFLADISDTNPRLMVMAALKQMDDDPLKYFTGETHAPDQLTDREKKFLETLPQEQEDHHRLNYPKWMEAALKERFGVKFNEELLALNERAPLTLRIARNSEKIITFLEDKDIAYHRGIHANSALIIEEQQQIRDWPIYREGLVEIQDEAAQLAVKYVELRPGQQVMDLCAGAGGKALAAAGYMKNKGQIYAFDIHESRLKELKLRAKRAKQHIFQSYVLTPKNRNEKLAEFKEKMDRVIVDVPCSGTGTWRRNPESKWRMTPDLLKEYINTQTTLLEEAWQAVKPGGRVAYMTCSVLKSENEDQILSFLKKHEDAALVPIKKNGIEQLDGTLQLSPYSRGTDGFFVAILEKTDINSKSK